MSPSEPSRSPDLASQLTLEGAAWQGLLTVLGEEEQALVNGEADHLARLNAAKLEQLQILNKLARTRHDALLAAGHTADHAGMRAWLAQHAPEQRTHWQQLCDMELQAQAQNQRIGSLIELRLASTRQALNVLVQAATRQGGLYDQGGLSVASRTGKPLTAA
jgi:flagella synthesis protein FlgN